MFFVVMIIDCGVRGFFDWGVDNGGSGVELVIDMSVVLYGNWCLFDLVLFDRNVVSGVGEF